MSEYNEDFMDLMKNHLDEKGEKAREAVKHFGKIDGKIIWGFTLDDSEMAETSGSIRFGNSHFNPQKYGSPVRIVIDADPEYKYTLVRIYDTKN